MRVGLIALAIPLLFVLALLPWLISAQTPRPLLPDELKQERVYYEQTAASVRTRTMVAQRAEESSLSVVVLGTLVSTSTAIPNALPAAPLIPTRPAATAAPSVTPTVRSEIVIRVSTPIAAIPSSRPGVVVESQTSARATPLPSATGPASSPDVRPQSTIPGGGRSTTVTDVITEEALTEQARKDRTLDDISDLTVHIEPGGMSARGVVTIFLVRRTFDSRGVLQVRDNNLKVNISSVLIGQDDVTAQYRAMVENRVDWGLYQLLPQRFVQKFQYERGRVVVTSLLRTP